MKLRNKKTRKIYLLVPIMRLYDAKGEEKIIEIKSWKALFEEFEEIK